MLSEKIQQLPPSAFAFVMATGILSIAANMGGHAVLAWSLFVINLTGFVLLWGCTAVRLIRYGHEVAADFENASRAPGFLTIVASTCVLGNQVLLLTGSAVAGASLWLTGGGLWLFLLYGVLAVQIVHERKPTLDDGFNGTWLLTTVATQSLAVLGALLASHFGEWEELMLFVSVCCFLVGGFLYFLIVTLLLYRLLFFPLRPETLAPPYWIDMGAEAISTLAGANLILHAANSQALLMMLPWLHGFTLFFWATATWWIPLLLILGVWRHVIRHVPFRYSTGYWSLVFPLGMYAACTFQVRNALALPIPSAFPKLFLYIALAAWLATFWGLIAEHAIRRMATMAAAAPRH